MGQSNGDVEIPPEYFSKSRFWIFSILVPWGLMLLSGCISMRKIMGTFYRFIQRRGLAPDHFFEI